jgi:hypothetical protein
MMGAARAAPLSYEQHSDIFCQSGEAVSPAFLENFFSANSFCT